jgi:hypothetical protein
MKTLSEPAERERRALSFQQRFIQLVKEEAESEPIGEWTPEAFEFWLAMLRSVRDRLRRVRGGLERTLARGVEANAFACSYGENSKAINGLLEAVRTLTGLFSTADAEATGLAAATEELLIEARAYRDRVLEVLSLATGPLPALDLDRLKQESDADFAAGRFVAYTDPAEMQKGLTPDG